MYCAEGCHVGARKGYIRCMLACEGKYKSSAGSCRFVSPCCCDHLIVSMRREMTSFLRLRPSWPVLLTVLVVARTNLHTLGPPSSILIS